MRHWQHQVVDGLGTVVDFGSWKIAAAAVDSCRQQYAEDVDVVSSAEPSRHQQRMHMGSTCRSRSLNGCVDGNTEVCVSASNLDRKSPPTMAPGLCSRLHI